MALLLVRPTGSAGAGSVHHFRLFQTKSSRTIPLLDPAEMNGCRPSLTVVHHAEEMVWSPALLPDLPPLASFSPVAPVLSPYSLCYYPGLVSDGSLPNDGNSKSSDGSPAAATVNIKPPTSPAIFEHQERPDKHK